MEGDREDPAPEGAVIAQSHSTFAVISKRDMFEDLNEYLAQAFNVLYGQGQIAEVER